MLKYGIPIQKAASKQNKEVLVKVLGYFSQQHFEMACNKFLFLGDQTYKIFDKHFISLVDSSGRQSRNLPYVPVYQQQFLKLDGLVQSIGQ